MRKCNVCGKPFDSARPNAKFCGPTCRKRHSRGATSHAQDTPPTGPAEDNPLVKSTRAELEAAGKLDTRLGQQALILAGLMAGTEILTGVSTVSQELDRVMAAATGAKTRPGASTADGIDELRARRDAKRAG